MRSASNFSTFPRFHSVCASVSMFTIIIDNRLFLFLFLLLFLVSPSLQPRRHIHHRLTSGLPCSISGLQPFTRSIIDFVSRLELVLVSSTVHLCVPFDGMLPIDPSNNSPFLQHSMLSRSVSTLPISNCGFRSVPPNLVRYASLVQIRIHKACSWAGPLAKCFAASVKSNLSWVNQFAPCRVNLIQNLIVFRLIKLALSRFSSSNHTDVASCFNDHNSTSQDFSSLNL